MYRTYHTDGRVFDKWFSEPTPAVNTTQQFQKQWFGPRHNYVHNLYFGAPNVMAIRNEVKRRGNFNALPSETATLESMDRQWETNFLPWGNIDLVAPKNYGNLLQTCSENVTSELVANMRQMQAAATAYRYDQNTHGIGRIGQLDRPYMGEMRRGHVPIELQLR